MGKGVSKQEQSLLRPGVPTFATLLAEGAGVWTDLAMLTVWSTGVRHRQHLGSC